MQIKKINNNNFNFISKKLSKRFPSILFYSIQNEFVVKVPKNLVKNFFTFLKYHTTTNFAQLIDITAIDHPERQYRFEVVYQLLSYSYNQRLTVNVSVPEGYNVDSITSIYPSAGWYEREVWDMFGIFFKNHSDFRRRLTDYGFKGHPLRKDFPVTGFIEVRYDLFSKSIQYEKVSLPQEYRFFFNYGQWL